MFIAVINENFDIAEEAKRSQQAQSFWAQQSQGQGGTRSEWLKKLNPYRWVQANPVTVQVPNMPANLVLPMKKTLVQDLYSRDTQGQGRSRDPVPGNITSFGTMNSDVQGASQQGKHFRDRSLTLMQRMFATTAARSDDVPLATWGAGTGTASLGKGKRTSIVDDSLDDETEKNL
jgi:hypothetical protein